MDILFSNTKEGIHIRAKELGMKAYYLGCDCYQCNKEFDQELEGLDKMDKTGGYCPKCDTVWVAPGNCRCVGIKSEGAMIAEAEMKEASDRLKDGLTQDQIKYLNERAEATRKRWKDHEASVFEIEVWNKAIEAAAELINDPYIYDKIRGLKK